MLGERSRVGLCAGGSRISSSTRSGGLPGSRHASRAPGTRGWRRGSHSSLRAGIGRLKDSTRLSPHFGRIRMPSRRSVQDRGPLSIGDPTPTGDPCVCLSCQPPHEPTHSKRTDSTMLSISRSTSRTSARVTRTARARPGGYRLPGRFVSASMTRRLPWTSTIHTLMTSPG